jgi:hypothetical protein
MQKKSLFNEWETIKSARVLTIFSEPTSTSISDKKRVITTKNQLSQIFHSFSLQFSSYSAQYKYALGQAECPCPNCKHIGIDVIFTTSPAVVLWGELLFFTTVILFWIPCYLDTCKSIEIRCSKCGIVKYIARGPCCGWWLLFMLQFNFY